MALYPLLFRPALKNYLWGGRRLASLFGRSLPDEPIAESWEIAAHPDGESVASNGVWAGHTLSQIHQKLGLRLIGRNNEWAQKRGKFPLLVKLLDAHTPLSVQVHPDDEYALAHEGNELGKTEMWYVLHADPGSAIILGVKNETTPESFAQALHDGQLEPHLHVIPVQTGAFVDVPAGSLHAILGGLVIAEIQQNSNTTYRVYDWNRRDAQGRSRPLHIEKGLKVINFAQKEPQLSAGRLLESKEGWQRRLLVENRYFSAEEITLSAGERYDGRCDGSTLQIWGCVRGNATVTGGEMTVSLPAITFTLLPAEMGAFSISAETDCLFLKTQTP